MNNGYLSVSDLSMSKWTKPALLAKCGELGISVSSKCLKKDLIDAIMKHTSPTVLPSSSTNHASLSQLDDKSDSCANIDAVNYSNISVHLTHLLGSAEKKQQGVYFTPPDTIIQHLKWLSPYMKRIHKVLEPSCGSCEYLLKIHQMYPHTTITGVEFNDVIYENIKHLQVENERITLYKEDFLQYANVDDTGYDLIIGNPPYFVISKDAVDRIYNSYYDGRPNIFILFIIKSLTMLNENGILSFILPKSFLNCLYYEKTRAFIYHHFKLLLVMECKDKYMETLQETVIVVIQKAKHITQLTITSNNAFTFHYGNYHIFGTPDTIRQLHALCSNSKTLEQLGFRASVGNVVWNQCVSELTNDPSHTLLIYSSNIKNNQLEVCSYKNAKKKNYIQRAGETSPLLVVNRGYGVGKYQFSYCFIDMEKEYCVENHLICIKPICPMTPDKLRTIYRKIMASFEKKETSDFIQLYFGNNAINTTEMNEILPIYDI